jgi:oxaloacetate decarboxylase alpha subunit
MGEEKMGMAKIDLVEISIRDGNQSLWGATGLNTAQILEIAPVMDRVGYRAIDFNSSTHMAVAVRYARENPWERIRLMHAACPNTPLQYITTGFRFIAWETAHPDFMRLVYRKIAEAGIGRVIMLDPMHNLGGFLTGARMMKEEGIADVMAALTYTISDVHDDAFYANLAREFAKCPHIDRAYIKDPAGILLPDRARTLVPAVMKALGSKPLEIHAHCTIGLAPLTYMVAAEHGISAVHVGAGALANGTSLPQGSRIVSNLREMGHTVDIDDRALGKVESYFTRLADAEGLPHGTPQEFDAAYLRHQMPGGAITTMQRQLKEIGQEHRIAQVMEEIPRVRAELGYPIMVTPFPQIVSTQAMMNVTGAGRYATVSDQVIRYVLEKFGHPTAPVDANIKDKILNRPRAKELANEPPQPSPAELRKRFGPKMSDEEMLLRAVMPEDQVNAMLAAGPAKRGYNPDSRGVAELLRELTTRPPVSELSVEKPGLKVTLRSKASPTA